MFARLVLAFFLAAGLMAHGRGSWNVSSRLAAIESLVDRGTLIIDASPFKTGDKYRYGGHYYSDKPPVLALAGAGVALALRAARLDIVRQPRIVTIALTVVLVALPFALGIGTLFDLLRLLGTETRWAAAVATMAGSATLAFPFATVLLNHVPAAALLLGALNLLTRSRVEGNQAWAAVAGCLLSIAVGVDTSYAIFLVLAPIALGGAGARAYLAYVAGAAPVILALVCSDFALSGDLRPPDTNAALFNWPGSEFANGHLAGGLVSRSLQSMLLYAFNLLLGVRGLILYSPILAFGTFALFQRLRAVSAPHRSLYLFVAIVTATYIASTIVATIDYGGDAYGTRTFVGIGILLCIPLGSLDDKLRANSTLRVMFLGVLAASTVLALIGVIDPFSSAPFPLLDAMPGIVRLTAAHHVIGLLYIAALSTFGTLSFSFVVRSLRCESVARVHTRAVPPPLS